MGHEADDVGAPGVRALRGGAGEGKEAGVRALLHESRYAR